MNALSFINPRFTSDLFDVIDRNFSDYTPAATSKEMFSTPRVDVRETKDQYILDMELPGMTEKDVEINLKDRVLSITSSKEEKKEDKKEEKDGNEYLIRERKSEKFFRSFTLPDDIDADKVGAAFKNGLLTINIPRHAETKTRQIAISA